MTQAGISMCSQSHDQPGQHIDDEVVRAIINELLTLEQNNIDRASRGGDTDNHREMAKKAAAVIMRYMPGTDGKK